MQKLHEGLLQLNAATLAGLLCLVLWWLPVLILAQDSQQASVQPKMSWISVNDPTALCNDFTRAGFFIRRNVSSNNWVVFLESGGLCYNTESCNRRFFARKVREEFYHETCTVSEVIPYGSFEPSTAWNETILNGREPARVVSPLMTSMKCFENVREFFPSGLDSSIEGRDILDTDPTKNSLFYSYNHVLIPYCSSDVWLGEESANTEAVETDTSECNCFNYTSDGCFNFNPKSPNLQFTFRGKIIYQSVIQQLLSDYGMVDADKVILAGSSAGGLGAINHAKWTRQVLSPTTELKVILDSAWFIDFQNGIEETFNGASSSSNSTSQRLLNVLMSNSACNDTDRLGYPCCISAHCILTQRNSEGELQYYPKDTPTFALFSIYDIYPLAPGLAGVAILELVQELTNIDDGIGVILDVLRGFGEYGGTMNYTIDLATAQAPFLSYYVTQCFQHIYLATSTLWGAEGQSVFGSDFLEFTRGTSSFSHFISSGRWTQLYLAANSSRVPAANCSRVPAANCSRVPAVNCTRVPATVSDALTSWLALNGSGSVVYTDTCQGVFCNPQCPDKLRLGELTSNNWHIGIKILIAVLVFGLALACVIVKIMFALWLTQLEKEQRDYLESFVKELENEATAKPKFPHCLEGISVSCLDLCYSVKVNKKTAFKDEKFDETSPVLLQELVEEDSDKGPLAHISSNSDNTNYTTEYQSSVGRRKLVKQKISYDVDVECELHTPEEHLAVPEEPQDLNKRVILDGISVHFKPGELVGIMGPSGCGKTTFLDLLTGRRKTGFIQGTVYVSGTPIDDIHEKYIANTGYVLQLASPYYEELTVRENLTLAAQLKLPKSKPLREKFERIEQVMHVTGLLKVSELKVGGRTGPGLSGGQKKRLIIALQLLNLPSVIFLDEPTSGLDSTSSFELLTHLNKLADSNRTVVLTIHQPRLEIFHMFHHLVLLSNGKTALERAVFRNADLVPPQPMLFGQVSYNDRPEKAYEVFVSALASRYLNHDLVIPTLLEAHNPADIIMDMLGNTKIRNIITERYYLSSEPMRAREAITDARSKKYSVEAQESRWEILRHIVFGAENNAEQSSTFTRMAVLEARADKRALKNTLAFLPFVMFLVFGFVLGTTYYQIEKSLLVVSGMCVFSTASALFMFPAMFLYYEPALQMYKFEKADGVGCAYDIVIQGFVRFASIALLPVIVSVAVIYLLLVNLESYNILVFLQVLLVNITLNQTWIALLIALICSSRNISFRLSPVIAAVAGFSSGFLIPVGLLPPWYHWMIYFNPNYFGLSSVAYFVLSDFVTGCTGNQLECYISSGPYILNQFFFDEINPYLHLAVLLGFTLFYLMLATLANWAWHSTFFSRLNRLTLILEPESHDTRTRELDAHHHRYEKQFSQHLQDDESIMELKQEEKFDKIEEEAFIEDVTVHSLNTKSVKSDAVVEEGFVQLPKIEQQEKYKLSLPDQEKQLCTEDFALSLKNIQSPSGSGQLQKFEPKESLKARQRMLHDRITVTQAVLPDEILKRQGETKPRKKLTFREASHRVIARQHSHLPLSDVVTEYIMKMKAEGVKDVGTSIQGSTTSSGLRRRYDTQISDGKCGSIPLDMWCKIVKESGIGSD